VIGSAGLVGNSYSLFLFARQKVHRIFHNLLFLLAIFDLVSEARGRFFYFAVGETCDQ
jgi:hypothetical protein